MPEDASKKYQEIMNNTSAALTSGIMKVDQQFVDQLKEIDGKELGDLLSQVEPTTGLTLPEMVVMLKHKGLAEALVDKAPEVFEVKFTHEVSSEAKQNFLASKIRSSLAAKHNMKSGISLHDNASEELQSVISKKDSALETPQTSAKITAALKKEAMNIGKKAMGPTPKAGGNTLGVKGKEGPDFP